MLQFIERITEIQTQMSNRDKAMDNVDGVTSRLRTENDKLKMTLVERWGKLRQFDHSCQLSTREKVGEGVERTAKGERITARHVGRE